MVSFADGACGVAITARQVAATGSPALFVGGRDGDYAWEDDPLSGPGSRADDQALEVRAAREPKVRVDAATGR